MVATSLIQTIVLLATVVGASTLPASVISSGSTSRRSPSKRGQDGSSSGYSSVVVFGDSFSDNGEF